MNPAVTLHREAMNYADAAELARLRGDLDGARSSFRLAFEAERSAAEHFRERLDAEPNRSVLYRSAASLALDCGEIQEAERLIATGLAGYPPPEIADELRDLLEQVHFQRHLDVRGLTLDEDEIQLSIAGPSVGFGVARSEEFVARVNHVETLLFRTAERHRGRKYREGGAPVRSIRREYEVYMSAPRAASFAVSLRLGSPKEQFALLPDEEAPAIVADLIQCLVLFNEGDQGALRERIPEASYFRNFVGLAKQLAPDGEDVRVVGITAQSAGMEQRVALTRPRDEIPPMAPPAEPVETHVERRTVIGFLRFADAVHPDQQKIKLVDDAGKRHNIIVPEGMMTDIVKPLWNDRVQVTGRRVPRALLLEDIQVAEPSASS